MHKDGGEVKCSQNTFNLSEASPKRESAYSAFARSHSNLFENDLIGVAVLEDFDK
jgi:hypothetical protein